MLEWGRELGASIAAESSDAPQRPGAADAAAIAAWTEAQLALPASQGLGGGLADVMVVVWPGGRILRVPRGTTAGEPGMVMGWLPRAGVGVGQHQGGVPCIRTCRCTCVLVLALPCYAPLSLGAAPAPIWLLPLWVCVLLLLPACEGPHACCGPPAPI